VLFRSIDPAQLDVLEKLGPELVYHFWLGESWQPAAGYAFLMGGRARQRYAMREAMAYFEQALLALAQLAEPPDEFTYQVLLGWEEAAFKFRPYPEQLSHLAQAEQIARRREDKPALIQALHWTANVYLARGQWTRAGPALMECLSLAEELGSEQLSVRPIYFKGLMTSFFDPSQALPWIERALHLAQKYGDVHIEALAHGTKGQVQAQMGDFAGSQQSIALARQAAARLGSPLTESDVDLLAAWACLAMGETDQGLSYGQRSVQKAIATDNMDCLCNGLACVGYGNLELQRVPEAVSAFEKGIQSSEISGAIIPKLNGQAGLAMAQFFRGRAEAVQELESVLQQMHLYDNEVGAANANAMLARCYLQLADFERAETHLEAAIEYYRRTQMSPFLARAMMSREELMKRRGVSAAR
jgi:tetratricopeptide (TPR) repeat protein